MTGAEGAPADLLAVNASRVVGDLADRVRESRREVETELRETLRRVGDVARGALEWARVVRAKGSEEVAEETPRIETLLVEVERMLEPIHDRAA